MTFPRHAFIALLLHYSITSHKLLAISRLRSDTCHLRLQATSQLLQDTVPQFLTLSITFHAHQLHNHPYLINYTTRSVAAMWSTLHVYSLHTYYATSPLWHTRHMVHHSTTWSTLHEYSLHTRYATSPLWHIRHMVYHPSNGVHSTCTPFIHILLHHHYGIPAI